MSSKKASGCENRKRKLEREKNISKSAKYFSKFLKPTNLSTTISVQSEKVLPPDGSSRNNSDNLNRNTSTFNENNDSDSEASNSEMIEIKENSQNIVTESENVFQHNDPATWPCPLPSAFRDHILSSNLLECTNPDCNPDYVYPRDSENRCFSVSIYYRVTKNGEKYLRKWLIYSKTANKVFCICCKLFFSEKVNSRLGSVGHSKWKHLHDYLKSHENSPEHIKNYFMWVEASAKFQKCKTIDEELQTIIIKEREHWKNVLDRLCNIVLYLSTHNLAFRGTSDQLNTPNNGNFLGLIELLCKYDVVLHEHVRRILSKETNVSYCSKTIQNEIISLLALGIRENIIDRTKKAKYFSIILDCTPDISHKEQLSVTLRFVDITEPLVVIQEHFISFYEIEESTGKSLFDKTKQILSDLKLNINDIRGQGYDNGSNMRGKNLGVQARLRQENPRAFYMPCGCHSLNLVIGDAAMSCPQSVLFFGVIQRLYTLFSASVGRWKILTDNVPNFTLKSICETRWESRIECIKAVRYQIVEIHDALIELSENSTDAATKHESTTLAEKLCDYSFLVILVTWYDILHRINIVSKSMQLKNIDLKNVVNLLKSCTEYATQYRTQGFENALIEARELAELLGTQPIFVEKRIARKKKLFDYESEDNVVANDEKSKFRITVFNTILDTIITSIQERFQQMKTYEESWGFLFKFTKNIDLSELRQHCMDLHIILQGEGEDSSDIDGNELFDEIKSLSSLIPENINSPVDMLQFLSANNLQHTVPNTWVALRILLTIPITVATAERSFSKLKLIKTYLRSTMGNERLNSLALLSIENAIAQKIDISERIKIFADLKARKKVF